MKVKELIKTLKELNQEAIVIMSKDSEGNMFSPLDDIESSVYIPNSTYSGESRPTFKGDMEKDVDDFNDFLGNYYDDFADFEYSEMCKKHGKELTDDEIKVIIFDICKKSYLELLNNKENSAICLWPVN